MCFDGNNEITILRFDNPFYNLLFKTNAVLQTSGYQFYFQNKAWCIKYTMNNFHVIMKS